MVLVKLSVKCSVKRKEKITDFGNKLIFIFVIDKSKNLIGLIAHVRNCRKAYGKVVKL